MLTLPNVIRERFLTNKAVEAVDLIFSVWISSFVKLTLKLIYYVHNNPKTFTFLFIRFNPDGMYHVLLKIMIQSLEIDFLMGIFRIHAEHKQTYTYMDLRVVQYEETAVL